ncbi:HesB/IscA family protein [Candidatus Cytomitobacter primus]|uniref:Iron-sulfur cluster assembly accessory protein n=1 Tax=Candidatus Cytomitobacter primus TaxID=2066024 RepID=A0A5C0UEE6_9PROT|nr:iron-sulfur cluster assembly accessory protein [Candidatus Cytomitobacter primus]QEK38418.1 iron-sulfur cluster assembly accessory protein [Candidatus Cytomitobacter primus]
MVYLSENAINRLDQMKKSFVKIKVFFGGCNGFKYEFSFPESSMEEDVAFQHQNKTVLVDKFTLSKIENATIDFIENLMEEKFQITSQHFKKTCHCGTSFKA